MRSGAPFFPRLQRSIQANFATCRTRYKRRYPRRSCHFPILLTRKDGDSRNKRNFARVYRFQGWIERIASIPTARQGCTPSSEKVRAVDTTESNLERVFRQFSKTVQRDRSRSCVIM